MDLWALRACLVEPTAWSRSMRCRNFASRRLPMRRSLAGHRAGRSRSLPVLAPISFHGTAFDYLRNDLFDANNWFSGYTNNPPLPKAEERQNDFGGTLSGPLIKDKTFFFFSYEGLRLRLPQTALTTVPDINARQSAIPAMQPFLNAFPLPNGADDPTNAIASFNTSYSNPASLDAYSLRVDHRLSNKLNLFVRYNYSPSEIAQRGLFGTALSTTAPSRITTQTGTAGFDWNILPEVINDFRVNYSRTNASTRFLIDNFGGATPLTSLPLPSPYTPENGSLFFAIFSVTNGELQAGAEIANLQRQENVVDNISAQKGAHSLKFGVDYRRLSPVYAPFLYGQNVYMNDVPSAESGTVLASYIQAGAGATLLLHNLGVFAQDTWRTTPRLTITYGLRWDVDFSPSSANGTSLPAATGFNLSDLSHLALAPGGTSPFKTRYGNIAPRVGAAYEISQNQNWGTVVRGGFGVFYDLATSEVGNLILQSGYPFNASTDFQFGGSFPLSPSAAAPPAIVPPNATNQGTLTAFDPNLELPYTLEWNTALQQGLGKQQTISASYIGSAGRRLIQTAGVSSPNPNLGRAVLISNAATSDYDALQLQYQRRLERGLQVLASYTWSHSIDEASAGSYGNAANALTPGLDPRINRGPSDFDIRNAFSFALTYDIPVMHDRGVAKLLAGGWSLENVVQARSAPPVNIFDSLYGLQFFNARTLIRPDVVPGVPLYVYGPQYPGGKAFNAAAFTEPPTDPNTGAVVRQGDLGRNALRGFGAAQWDFAVHREFIIREPLKLQFRAELFNILNHPNFGQPDNNLHDSIFGRSTNMLAQYLSGGQLGAGGFNSLYQIGGPRSIQFALKLIF